MNREGKGNPGSRVRAMDGREGGTNRGIPAWGVASRRVPGRGEKVAREVLKSTTSLADPSCTGTGSEDVARLGAVCTEASISPTTTLLDGKRGTRTSGAVHLHGSGLGMGGRRLMGKRGGQGRGTGNEWRRTWLRRGLGARKGGSRLILLDRDGCSQVSREKGGDETSGRKLETDGLL